MRFAGSVLRLGKVEPDGLARWAEGIPYDEWPQQHPVNGQLRPAMISQLDWRGFGMASDGLVAQVRKLVPAELLPGQRILSVVMPGHDIEPHVDKQLPLWWGRVHVPLMTDHRSIFIVGEGVFHLEVGSAYVVNTQKMHSVSNADGKVPRLHFMVDFEL